MSDNFIKNSILGVSATVLTMWLGWISLSMVELKSNISVVIAQAAWSETVNQKTIDLIATLHTKVEENRERIIRLETSRPRN